MANFDPGRSDRNVVAVLFSNCISMAQISIWIRSNASIKHKSSRAIVKFVCKLIVIHRWARLQRYWTFVFGFFDRRLEV